MKTIKCGGSGPSDQRAKAGEDRIAGLLGRLLDDDYYLLRNVALPGDPYDLDMVLVGPAGVWEFEILHFQRLVSINGIWMHRAPGQVAQAIPLILIQRTLEKVTRLKEFLAQNGITGVGEVNQVNILSSPHEPRDFTLPGLQVVFVEEMEGFVKTAVRLFKAGQPVPVAKIIKVLCGAELRPASPRFQLTAAERRLLMFLLTAVLVLAGLAAVALGYYLYLRL